MPLHRAAVPVVLAVLAALATAGCSDKSHDYGDSGYSSSTSGDGEADESSGGGCGDVEALLAGKWITEGDTEDSRQYNTLEFDAGSKRGSYYLYADGYWVTEGYDWWVGAGCDTLHLDYDETSIDPEQAYSFIQELSNLALQLQANDGSELGDTTRYDRLSGGVYGEEGCPVTIINDYSEEVEQIEVTLTDSAGEEHTSLVTPEHREDLAGIVAPGIVQVDSVQRLIEGWEWDDTGTRTLTQSDTITCGGDGAELSYTFGTP